MITKPVRQTDENLDALLEKLKKLRGPSEVRLRKSNAVSKWIAENGDLPFSSDLRVICKGEWQNEIINIPAVLTFNSRTRIFEAWVADGDDDQIVVRDAELFYSTTPHQSAAREVFGKHADTNSTI